MRVLFLTGEFPPMQGGVGDCTNEIAGGLATLGAEVQVLTSTRAVGDEFKIRNSRFEIQPIIAQWNWFSLRVIARALREFAPDIAHIQYQTGAFGMHPAIDFAPRLLTSHPLGPLSPLLTKFRQERGEGEGGSGVRFVTTFHDLREPYLFPKAGPVREWVTRELARASDAVIATNDEDYARLATRNLRRVTLIPIGSNITTTTPADYDRAAWRAKLNVRDDETLLCYFGFLNESKGGETLIRALALTPHAKLLMLGGQVGASDPTNAAYLAHVKSLISNLQIADRVLWTDFAPSEIVTAHFRASDLCVMPYREGASYRHGTLLAALAHGCAIVTTVNSERSTVNRILPQLRDGENCLLVPPDAPRALADAIRRAAASPELRAKIGAGARELAQHFTWDKIARQHLELYERIVNRE